MTGRNFMLEILKIAGLCPADQRHLNEVLRMVQAYAAGACGVSEAEELAKLLRLPSLRGHIPKPERPFISLRLTEPGEITGCTRVHPGVGAHQEDVSRDAFLVWEEQEGRASLRLVREDQDKYGIYYQPAGEPVGEETVFAITPQAAADRQLEEDATGEELLAVAYRKEFLTPG